MYLFIIPRQSFYLNEVDVIQLVIFILNSFIVLFLIKRIRRDVAKFNERSEWFRTALRTIGDGVIVTNKDGKIVFLNSNAESLTGWKKEDAINEDIEMVYKTSRNDLGQAFLISKTGAETPIEESAAPVMIENSLDQWGEVLVFKDISDKTNAETRYRLASEASEVGIWELTLESKEIEGNSFFHKSLGYIKNQWSYEELVQHIFKDDREEFVRSINQVSISRKSFNLDCRVVWPDNSLHWVSFAAKAGLDLQGKVHKIIGTAIDITSKKKVEEVLHEALFYRDEFLSIASHELKTPLTSLKLQSQIFKRNILKGDQDTYHPNKVDRLVDQVDKQVSRLVRLVDDMLDISRIRTGRLTINKEHVDLSELIHEIVDRVKPQFGTHIPDVKISGPCLVYCDKIRVEQVMHNLLNNALRYGKGMPVSVVLHRNSDQVELRVIDQGIGIAPENHEKIFNRFQRAVPAREISGLGLGLYIARQIVEAHDGKIFVESELNRGATFTVELPLQ